MIAFKGGFVAVGGIVGACCAGGNSPDTRATVWLSRDGRTWELLPPQSAFAHGQMLSVAANQNLIVAVGFKSLPSATPGLDDIRPGTWWSSDGLHWHLVEGSPTLSIIAEHGGTFFGVSEGPAGDEIWRSSDGQTWTRAATAGELGLFHVRGITSGEFGVVTWGAESNGTATVIWRSTNGTSWTRTSGPFGDASVEVITSRAGSSGLLALGQRGDKQWTIWTSADGLTWSESTAPAVRDGDLTLAFGTSRGFLLVGMEGSRLHLWASSSGSIWSEVAIGSAAMLPPAHMDAEQIVAFAESADGALAAVGDVSKPGLNGISAAWLIRP